MNHFWITYLPSVIEVSVEVIQPWRVALTKGNCLSLVKHLVCQTVGNESGFVMKKSLCEFLMENFPKTSDAEELRSTYIANCVFNSFLAYTAIMLNIVTIHAIRKTPSLPNTLKTLLLSLAVSDTGVGLLVQPYYISLFVKWSHQNLPGCNTYIAFSIISLSFCVASFLGVVALSVDRFLAIHLHLRYQELVTRNRVATVVISIWLISVIFSLMLLWLPGNVYLIITFSFGLLYLLLTTMIYIRLYLTVRRLRHQIQPAQQIQQAVQTGEMGNFISLMKSAVGIFYVYLVFLICYLPFLTSLVALEINGPSFSLKSFLLYSWTVIYLNSSLNPVIYCWKMRHIRHAIMDILQNMPWLRNRSSHFS